MGMQRTPLLMHTLVERGAVVAPDEQVVTATATGVRRQTYKQTRDRAHQLAHALKASGIETGDRVGTFMWNGSRHLEAYHASAGMGAVLHTLNIRLSDTDLEYIINHCRHQANHCRCRYPAVAREARRTHTDGRARGGCRGGRRRGLEDASCRRRSITRRSSALIRRSTSGPRSTRTHPWGSVTRSGTTGNPKGVEYEHRSQYLHTITQCMTDAMGLAATDTLLGIVPMFHAMGWGLPWAMTMLGGRQVMPHRFMDPVKLVELMANEQVTISAGVPTIWQGVKAVLEANPGKYDLGPLERLTCGGSAPPPSLIRWYWDELGVEMVQGWGMTETSPLATTSRRLSRNARTGRSPRTSSSRTWRRRDSSCPDSRSRS